MYLELRKGTKMKDGFIEVYCSTENDPEVGTMVTRNDLLSRYSDVGSYPCGNGFVVWADRNSER